MGTAKAQPATTAVAMIQAGLPHAMARLAALTRSSDRGTALQAVRMLERYLLGPSAIAASAAQGAEAAAAHLDALRELKARRLELTPVTRRKHQWRVDVPIR